MTIISYHSTLFSNVATSLGAVDKTSSQIFLSGGVAGAESEHASESGSAGPPLVTSIFESDNIHIMTLGDATSRRFSGSMNGEASSLHRLFGKGVVDGDLKNTSVPANKSTILSTGADPKTPSTKPSPTGHKRPYVTSVDEGPSEHSPKRVLYDDELDIKGKGIERGRTLEREPRFPNPLARAESRPQREEPATEIDARPIEIRGLSRSTTFFEDPSDLCAVLEDSLLEPCPRIPLSSSVGEILHGEACPGSVISGIMKSNSWAISDRILSWQDLPRPIRAFTTVFNNCPVQSPAPQLSVVSNTITQSSTYARQLEEMTTTSSSSSTSIIHEEGVPESPQDPPNPVTALASQLPTEIVQQIFNNLSPVDFNSARHSCRSWFIHSLNKSLLETMLRRGGFSLGTAIITANNRYLENGNADDVVWLMSKRISRECALGPDWLGNGVSKLVPGGTKPSAFVNVTSVDFTEVAVHYLGLDSAGTVFTISTCGRFLMAANGCLVYVYELNRHHKPEGGAFPKRFGHLLPVTSIICPRRVLACSMDTSSHRYAIAILLDGRMGLVCDITTITRHTSPSTNTPVGSTSMRAPGSRTSGQNFSESARMQGTSFLDRVSLNSPSYTPRDRPSQDPPFVFPGIATTGAPFAGTCESEWQDVFQGDMPETSRTAGPSSRHASLPRAFVVGCDGELQEFSASTVDLEPSNSALRVEDGPRSLYRNLCSDDDPPRSVAICPQRRCVAFGCSSGIELHWVDALTGQDLNRWFPLTAPSDFLFFLPPRKSIDSAKKLRLISSAARPSERPAMSERSFGSQTSSSPFWERFGWGANHFVEGDDASSAQGILTRLRIDTNRTSFTGRMDCSDHYRAIPLSDGYHILFTDPATGLLCLGSDAPVGGPTKLLRKIWFKGPEGEGSPVVYAGGADLNWGVRVVAGFGNGAEQSVWLFSVPDDVFTANPATQLESSTPTWFSSSSSCGTQNIDWIKWWPDDGLQEWLNHVQDPVPGILPRSVWPVKIRGQRIGTCTGLVDLAIDSGPGISIWAFSKGGVATVWKLDDGKHEGMKRIWIQRDGTARQSEGDGDIEMADVSPQPSPNSFIGASFRQQSFDGSSTPSTVITTRCERRHRIEWSQHLIRYDTDGDVLMDDPYPGRSSLVGQNSSEDIVWEELDGPVYHQRGWWMSRSHRLHTRDVVEELTGIARIDVEIR